PISDIRWGLAATDGAYHDFHADTGGYCTFVQPDSGRKIWLLLSPKKGNRFDFLARIQVFVHNFSPDLPNPEDWEYDLVVLTPGMQLVMRPNTIHAVLTPDASICRGGHFYATATIRDSVYGLYHTFVASSYITNALHKSASEQMLMRMLRFFHHRLTTARDTKADDAAHLPDMNTFDGLLDLLCLCNFFEMQSVLSDWMYKASHHRTAERKRHVRNRALARQVVQWVFSNYDI
ncbi:hypothetical protein FPV67DRAFT_1359440, partial [Lyophyllum atratum]